MMIEVIIGGPAKMPAVTETEYGCDYNDYKIKIRPLI